ncbi:MAG: fibronectin type III domain-containing protein [Verrucomicrobiales bacterium]
MFFCGDVVGAGDIEFVDAAGSPVREVASDNGTVKLSWTTSEDDVSVIVEQSSSADFSLAVERYRGKDTGSVLTGLPEGGHYFRIAAEGTADWSPPLLATVTFFDRDSLKLLLSLGGLVVLATIGAIVGGHVMTVGRPVSDTTTTGKSIP